MRMLALTCIPIIGLSGCAMFQQQTEPTAYQAPAVKAAPVVKKAAPAKRRPMTAPSSETQDQDRSTPDVNRDGPPDPWT